MKSPLNIAQTIKLYGLDEDLKKKLIAFDGFIWKDYEVKSVSQLLSYEKKYQDYSSALSYCYDSEAGEFGAVFMCDGTLDLLCKGAFRRLSLCGKDDVAKGFQEAGLTELETIVIRSFLADISGLYRLDAYHFGVPPFVQSVCKVLDKALAKLPLYNEGVLVRACKEEDKADFKIGDVFVPGFCLTTSTDLDWEDTSANRYRITPTKDESTKARAIFTVHDNSEKQVTFLQNAQFRVVNVSDWGDNKKEIVMDEYTPVKINLVADMANIMRHELKEIGYKVNIPDDHELIIYYFTTCDRIVKKKPRKVHEAAGIVVPPSRKAGYDALKEKFEKGESVMPYLSKTIKGLKFQDKMLFDWGIHHFHIHEVIEPDGFVKQRDELLYAIVEEDDVYFIDVMEHEHWSDRDLLEKVLANWPHLLDSCRVGGTPVRDFSSEEVAAMREVNVNLILTLSDGYGYMGRGLGMTSAGTSANATILSNNMISDLKRIEKQVKEGNSTHVGKTLVFSLIRSGGDIFLEETTLGGSLKVFGFQSLRMKAL